MRHLLALVLALALLGSGAALAALQAGPQKRLTAADQTRARAMLLRKADLGFGYRVYPSSPEGQTSCKALDESDLTLTGDAKSPTFVSGLITIASDTDVYKSVADANASWRRGTSAGGVSCLEDTVRREYAKLGLRLLSLRKIAFPRLVRKTVAFRASFSGQSQGLTVRVYIDLVALQVSRAQAALVYGSVIDPLERAEQVRLARLVAGRMTKTMRGA